MLQKEERKQRVYLSINEGKVVKYDGKERELYSSISGHLLGISHKTSYFKGEAVERWYIDIADGADLYTLCLPYASGIYKALVLSLASYEPLSTQTLVRLEPYLGSNGFTKLSVYAEETRLDWVTKELPPIESVVVGGREYKDDTKRMELILSLTENINKKIGIIW